MKKIILSAILALAFTACQKSNTTPKFRIDPNAKVHFTGENSTKSSDTNHLTALEIVKQAGCLVFYNDYLSTSSHCTAVWQFRDTISNPPYLYRWATDILYDSTGTGGYVVTKDFIYGYDMVITKANQFMGSTDTIAYIPNATIENARNEILQALANHDTTAVYSIFQNAFKFVPCTGAEYLQLKANGQN